MSLINRVNGIHLSADAGGAELILFAGLLQHLLNDLLLLGFSWVYIHLYCTNNLMIVLCFL